MEDSRGSTVEENGSETLKARVSNRKSHVARAQTVTMGANTTHSSMVLFVAKVNHVGIEMSP